MRTPRIVAVSGWAHGSHALADLLRALEAPPESFPVGLHELAPDGAYAAGLVAHLEAAVEPVVLLGWSTGGLVTLEGALHLPEKVRALVLLAGCARYCNDRDYDCAVPPQNLRALLLGLRRRRQETLQGFFADCAYPEPEEPEELKKRVTAAVNMGYEELAAGLHYLQATDLRDRLHRLEVPTLVLHGSEDRVVPMAAGRCLAGALPWGEWRELNGAGHDLPGHAAEQVAAAVAPFLAELP